MAEYYPLLSRAVAGLRDGAPEPRQAIYARARQALTGQLRGMQPPVPEEAISKEITALDDAIAKIEAEIIPLRSVSDAASAAVEAALSFDAAASPPKPAEVPGPAPSPAPMAGSRPDVSQAVSPALKPPVSRPAAAVATRPTPPTLRPDRPVFAPRSNLPGARTTRPEPDTPAPSSGKPAQAEASEPSPSPADEPKPALPAAPTLESVVARGEGDVRAPELAVPSPDEASKPADNSAPAVDLRGRDEPVRPAMPRQSAAQPRNLRVWIVAVAALAAVVVIALTAWKLRDNPEELARIPKAVPQADSTPGKIVERADGAAPPEDDAADVGGATAGAAQPSSSSPAPQAATPVPAASAGTTAQPASDQTVPVSYKAAVLVAAPDTPEKVRTFVGSVVWRSEGSPQDPASLAVRADVDVPDAKLQMTMEIRKNTEAQFPASHTIDVKFTPGAGSTIGNVKQIDVPQMRREDAPTGDPLGGVPVTITNNSFLVGLSRGDAETRNLDAMRSRGWFDIPMVLEDGKPAKITFEKGASGDRILADALAAWGKS